jgi:hypothetical protein
MKFPAATVKKYRIVARPEDDHQVLGDIALYFQRMTHEPPPAGGFSGVDHPEYPGYTKRAKQKDQQHQEELISGQ